MSKTVTPAIARWMEDLPSLPWREAVPDPSAGAIFCADMTIGFCRDGALASPRLDALTLPVIESLRRAHEHGIRDFVLVQDLHSPDAREFESFPPHCVRGTEEVLTIPEITSFPFFEDFTIVEKNSLHPALGTALEVWLGAHGGMRHAIVVGNCTDLCFYQLAMHLKLRADAFGLGKLEVIVPASCVNTYDQPEDDAPPGAMPHDGDFFHAVFLYHLALNGVRVVKEIR